MLGEVTDIYDLEVFTHKGIFLGIVQEVMIDTSTRKVYELILRDTNPTLVEESRSLAIPYRWVRSISNVVLLRYFPGKVKIKRGGRQRRRRAKLRVIKRRWGEHGTSRQQWQ